jgi:hypothetical protein
MKTTSSTWQNKNKVMNIRHSMHPPKLPSPYRLHAPYMETTRKPGKIYPREPLQLLKWMEGWGMGDGSVIMLDAVK